MPTAKKGASQASPTSRKRVGKSATPVIEITKAPVEPLAFYAQTDWEDWYHEFATEKLRNGALKYTSAFEFAKSKGPNRATRDLILHTIGPVVPGKTPMYATKQYPQFDWEKMRRSGFWLGPEKLKAELAHITKESDTLAELRASGQAHLLPMIARVVGMMDKVEAEFSGLLFLPGASVAQNEARAGLYMRLVDHITKLTIQLQEAYARSLGINLNDLSGTVMVRDSIAARSSMEQDKTNKSQKFLSNILAMTLEKAESLKMPLPDGDIARQAVRSMVG